MTSVDCDFSAIEGTSCYCSEEAAAKIRNALLSVPLEAIHKIGTGDYHYVTLFMLEKISEPFSFVLFDNHPDDQEGEFGSELLSCGSWVREARRLPLLKDCRWIGRTADFSRLEALPGSLPVYISVDLDVLSTQYCHTDWNQGDMSLSELQSALKSLLESRRILGADICGGLSIQKGASPEDITLNNATEEALSSIFFL